MGIFVSVMRYFVILSLYAKGPCQELVSMLVAFVKFLLAEVTGQRLWQMALMLLHSTGVVSGPPVAELEISGMQDIFCEKLQIKEISIGCTSITRPTLTVLTIMNT